MSSSGMEERKGHEGGDEKDEEQSAVVQIPWQDRAKAEHVDRLKRRVAIAKKTHKLDLADPRPDLKSAFRFHLDTLPRPVIAAFRASSLQELWLTNNNFSMIPEFVTSLPNLITLCLSGNHISSITAPLFECKKLERLLLSRNSLVALPPEFEELTNLREIRLAHNHLARFPIPLTTLRNLRRLDLSHNRIVSVPPRIRRLTNLIELDLDNNRIGPALPPEVLRLSGLQVLGVASNCLEKAPEIHKRVAGALPMAILRISGNRSSSFKVYHESGVEIEGESIPRRADGYLQLRKGYLVTDLEGNQHRRVEELEGYLREGYRYNVASANWHRGADEYKVLKARARKRQMRKAVQVAEREAMDAEAAKRSAERQAKK